MRLKTEEIIKSFMKEDEIKDHPVHEDAISREWVLNEIITKVEDDDSLTNEQKGALSVAKYIIRHAPPVTPTERTGEWVRRWHLSPDCYQEWQCSECEYEMDGRTNYCPNCGADMRGEQDEK